MRVKIAGDSESSRVIRAYLTKAGVAICERLPKFALHCTIHLSEHSGTCIICDSVDSPLELHILRHITQNTTGDIILRRGTGIVSSENEIHLSIPAGDPDSAHAVELGILRGVQRAHFHRPWWKRLLPLLALALVPAGNAAPHPHHTPSPPELASETESGAVHISMPPGGLFPQFQTGGSISITVNTSSPLTGGGTISSGGVLTLSCPTCVTSSFTNPMTTSGDIIYGAASGTPNRLAASGLNTLLHSGGSNPTWSAVVQGDVTNGYDDLSTNQTIGGNKSYTGTLTMGNTVIVGTGGSLLTAVAACAALTVKSCVIDMRSGLGSHVLVPTVPLDPGFDISIKIILGPFTDYTAVGFVLRSSFWLEGSGSRNTTITSIGSNAQPLFTIPQTNNQPAFAVHVQAIGFVGAAGNTSQDGLFADCSTTTNTGLWYSNWYDTNWSNFKGVAHHEKSRPNDFQSTNQWNVYQNSSIVKVLGGGEAIRLEGGNTNELFIGGQFDGAAQTDLVSSNIYIGIIAGGTAAPNTIRFYGATVQNNGVGITINGVRHVYFHGMHHEKLNGGYSITFTATSLNNGISIEDSYFATTGVNAGSGFLVQNTDSQASYVFKHSNIITAPDKMVIGTAGENSDICCNLAAGTPGFNWIETGTTAQMTPLATLNVQKYKIVALNPSATAISTLQGMHAAGEEVTFVALSGGVASFASGGNLTLGAYQSPFTLQPAQTATFQRDSLNTNWHLIATSGNVLPNLAVDTLTLGANVGSTALFAVPNGTGAPTGGMYRICATTTVTRAATTSSTLPAAVASWTDRDSSGVITQNITPAAATAAGVVGQSTNANGGNATTTGTSGCIPMNAKLGTFINYSTTGYASAGATTMQYSLHIRLEAM